MVRYHQQNPLFQGILGLLSKCFGSFHNSGLIYIALDLHSIVSPNDQIFLKLHSPFDIIVLLWTNATESHSLAVRNGGFLMARVTSVIICPSFKITFTSRNTAIKLIRPFSCKFDGRMYSIYLMATGVGAAGAPWAAALFVAIFRTCKHWTSMGSH